MKHRPKNNCKSSTPYEMNLAIDIGNTRVKWALFQDDTLRGLHSMSADEIASLEPSPLCPLLAVLPPELQNPDHIILCNYLVTGCSGGAFDMAPHRIQFYLRGRG